MPFGLKTGKRIVRSSAKVVGRIVKLDIERALKSAIDTFDLKRPASPLTAALYGVGDPAELKVPGNAEALKCLIHGSRRKRLIRGGTHGGMLMWANLLHSAAVALYIVGCIVSLLGRRETGPAAAAGAAIHVFSYAHRFARAIFRLVDALKGDREIHTVKSHIAETDRSSYVALGTFLRSFRLIALALEVWASVILFLAGVIWFVTQRHGGIYEALRLVLPGQRHLLPSHEKAVSVFGIVWLFGSFCLLVGNMIEANLVHETWATSKMLPGHSQRDRASYEMVAQDGYMLSSLLLVVGAVYMVTRDWYPAHLVSLIAGLVGAGCCILDYYVARNTAKIRVNDNSYVLAAQVQLDCQHIPLAGFLPTLIDCLFEVHTKSDHPLDISQYKERIKHFAEEAMLQ